MSVPIDHWTQGRRLFELRRDTVERRYRLYSGSTPTGAALEVTDSVDFAQAMTRRIEFLLEYNRNLIQGLSIAEGELAASNVEAATRAVKTALALPGRSE